MVTPEVEDMRDDGAGIKGKLVGMAEEKYGGGDVGQEDSGNKETGSRRED